MPTDEAITTNRWRQRLWPTGLALLLVLTVVPVQSELVRHAWLGLASVLLVSAWWMWRRIPWLRTIPLTLIVLACWAWFAPGDPLDENRLRQTYRTRLQAFDSTPYKLGGSTRLGIDEGGHVVAAMMQALGREAVAGRNAAALRQRWHLWWLAPSLADLRDEYRSLMIPIGQAGDLVAAQSLDLAVGDLAVSWTGSNAWTYIGNQQWLGMNEAVGGMVTIDTSHDHAIVSGALAPVKLLRWRFLAPSTTQATPPDVSQR